MNKLKLASLSLLLAGATAMPAMAQSVGGEQSRGGRESDQGDKGRYREQPAERREERREDRREDRREERTELRRDIPAGSPGAVSQGWRAGNREDRQDYRRDARDDRQDYRRDRREDRREWVADRNDYRQDRRDDRRDWREDRRDDRRDWRDDRRDDNRYVRHSDRRWNGYNWYPQYRYRAPARYVYPRDYRPYRWSVGHRLPYSYYQRNYYVDYRAYSLPPPPYGYHWVRVDRDVVLVAIASGLIRDVLYGLYY